MLLVTYQDRSTNMASILVRDATGMELARIPGSESGVYHVSQRPPWGHLYANRFEEVLRKFLG